MDHVTAMREEIEKLEKELPDIPFVMGVAEKDDEDLTDIPLHIRGSPKNLGERVPRGFPLVLQGGEPERYTEGSGRLRLAQDIVAQGGPRGLEDKEVIAITAYLQRLGTDIRWREREKGEPPPIDVAAAPPPVGNLSDGGGR
jgi:hypothetical protein